MKKEHIIEILILLLILALICTGIFLFQKNHFKTHTYKLDFEDGDGIIKGSPVKFMGVIVGHVSDLKYKDKQIIANILITKKEIDIPFKKLNFIKHKNKFILLFILITLYSNYNIKK